MDGYRKTNVPANRTKVVIRVDKEVARYIQTGRRYYGFESERAVGDQVEMTFLTPDVRDGFPRWFMMFGDCAVIVEPESLRERVVELLEKTGANLKPGN